MIQNEIIKPVDNVGGCPGSLAKIISISCVFLKEFQILYWYITSIFICFYILDESNEMIVIDILKLDRIFLKRYYFINKLQIVIF